MVEFAFVAPIFFAVLFGLIDFGFAFSDWQNVREGSREATRQISAGTTGGVGYTPTCAWDPSAPDGQNVYDTGTYSDRTREAVCYVKDRVGLLDSDVRVKLDLPSGYHQTGDSIVICVMYPLDSLTGFYDGALGDTIVTDRVEMRVDEETVGYPLQAVQEHSLDGEDWSFC